MADLNLRTEITYFGQPATVGCDANCAKAWGHNSRPRVQVTSNDDDFAYLADGELGAAPVDPGTYEGDHAKPLRVPDRHNKWCVRECERSAMVRPGEPLTLPDLSVRRNNLAVHVSQTGITR